MPLKESNKIQITVNFKIYGTNIAENICSIKFYAKSSFTRAKLQLNKAAQESQKFNPI